MKATKNTAALQAVGRQANSMMTLPYYGMETVLFFFSRHP
jgi:hypothetical protein